MEGEKGRRRKREKRKQWQHNSLVQEMMFVSTVEPVELYFHFALRLTNYVTGHVWASLSSKGLMDKIISQSHRARFKKHAVRNNFQEKIMPRRMHNSH